MEYIKLLQIFNLITIVLLLNCTLFTPMFGPLVRIKVPKTKIEGRADENENLFWSTLYQDQAQFSDIDASIMTVN